MNKLDSFELPSWTIGLPDHTLISKKDLSDILGLKRHTRNYGSTGIDYYLEREMFPKPDRKINRPGGRRPVPHWSLGLLRKFAEMKNPVDHDSR